MRMLKVHKKCVLLGQASCGQDSNKKMCTDSVKVARKKFDGDSV